MKPWRLCLIMVSHQITCITAYSRNFSTGSHFKVTNTFLATEQEGNETMYLSDNKQLLDEISPTSSLLHLNMVIFLTSKAEPDRCFIIPEELVRIN